MKRINPILIANRLAESKDRGHFQHQLQAYKLNFRESNFAKIYLNNLEKIIKIRR